MATSFRDDSEKFGKMDSLRKRDQWEFLYPDSNHCSLAPGGVETEGNDVHTCTCTRTCTRANRGQRIHARFFFYHSKKFRGGPSEVKVANGCEPFFVNCRGGMRGAGLSNSFSEQ